MLHLSHPSSLEQDPRAHMPDHPQGFTINLPVPAGAGEELWMSLVALAESVAATLATLGGEGESISAAPGALLTSRAAAGVSRHWSL
jgi:hypothetical protein